MKTKKIITALAMASVVLFVGCKKDDFTETPGVCPLIASTNPANGALNVPLDQKVTATFNSEMDASTITTISFIVTGSVVPGTVTYSGLTATFTPTDLLIPNHTYTGRITTTVKNVQGNALQKEYVWTFSTGSTLQPTVMSTDPLNNETNVALNKTIAATFNMKMKANTLNSPAANFTVKESVSGTAVAGIVTYNTGDSSVSFNPSGNLIAGTKYTATISKDVKNTLDTALVSDFVWTFTTGNLVAPTVLSTDPLNGATGVDFNKTVTATFSEAMDQATLIGANFTLKQGATIIAGTVTKTATTISFNPTINLLPSLNYTATISTGAKNLAATALASNKVWTFTTKAALPLGPGVVDLGTAADFASVGKAGITTTGVTKITGDIGVSPGAATSMTGFGLIMDATNQFSTSPIVTGKIYAADYAAPTPAKMTQAISDMENALTVALGMNVAPITELGAGNISGLTLVPGLYKWSTGLLISGGGVTLSGGPNDTWVFQVAQGITVNPNAKVTLLGGAQAKNIFWVTSLNVVLDTNSDFSGNIMAQTDIAMKSGAVITGRLLSQTAVTLIANTVVKP